MQRLVLGLLLSPLLWMAGTAAAAETAAVGLTGWDLVLRLLNSVPTIVLAIGATAWMVAKVFIAVVEVIQPERVRMRDLWSRQDDLDRDLKDSERRCGYLLVLVRELEHALEVCASSCPDCKGAVDTAINNARTKATARGLLREDDTTMPRGAATEGGHGHG